METTYKPMRLIDKLEDEVKIGIGLGWANSTFNKKKDTVWLIERVRKLETALEEAIPYIELTGAAEDARQALVEDIPRE